MPLPSEKACRSPRRLTEEGIFHPYLISLGDILDTLKPHQIDCSRSIGKGSHQPAARAFALRGIGYDATPQLYVGHRAGYLAYAIGLAAVDIFVGEVVEQVAIGANTQLASQQLGTLRSYTFKEFYVGL